MKVLVISILCAIASSASGGAVAWPGAISLSSPVVKTVIPGETKTTAYSTTQYINAVPAVATHPHFAFPAPQVQSFASFLPGYYSVASPSYIPATNIFYPSTPSFAPQTPIYPSVPSLSKPQAPNAPTFSEKPSDTHTLAGDEDSAIIESAERSEQLKKPGSGVAHPMPTSTPSQSFTQFSPANVNPNLPGNPENPPFPQFPQFPQVSQFPQIPQFPPNLFPQGPSQSRPVSSFPAPINENNSLNDEDTIAVESA